MERRHIVETHTKNKKKRNRKNQKNFSCLHCILVLHPITWFVHIYISFSPVCRQFCVLSSWDSEWSSVSVSTCPCEPGTHALLEYYVCILCINTHVSYNHIMWYNVVVFLVHSYMGIQFVVYINWHLRIVVYSLNDCIIINRPMYVVNAYHRTD